MAQGNPSEDLIKVPPQPSAEEQLAKALEVIDNKFKGDFAAFAKSVSPPPAPARKAKQMDELIELVGRA
ncbi:MAG: hypothetical protein HYV95_17800 [Opitutae bacterium]|nr:hypothetical protein [Opitutae bacterium]